MRGGGIHWGDETALVDPDVRGRSDAPRGKTPVAMAVGGTREKRSTISTAGARGRANGMTVDGNFEHERPIADLRNAVGSNLPVCTTAELHAAADEHMQFIAVDGDRLRSDFRDPLVKYAA